MYTNTVNNQKSEVEINTDYSRVIPRDLFNEAKLLKCIGRLCLLIHDGYAVNNMKFEHDGEPFIIGLADDGYLTVTNIVFEMNGHPLYFKSTYNAKTNFPLYLEVDYCDYLVFDEKGEYTEDFKAICNEL